MRYVNNNFKKWLVGKDNKMKFFFLTVSENESVFQIIDVITDHVEYIWRKHVESIGI